MIIELIKKMLENKINFEYIPRKEYEDIYIPNYFKPQLCVSINNDFYDIHNFDSGIISTRNINDTIDYIINKLNNE